MRMVQRGQSLSLAFEWRERLGLIRQCVGENLERDVAAQRVSRAR
jgi:hypothetical protein